MSLSLQQTRLRRSMRVRARIHGTSARPRLSVFRSNKGIYAQVIDDSRGVTLASASDLSAKKQRGTIASAKDVGTAVATAAKAAGVTSVVFDRSGYAYHGQVAALADAARAAGLSF